MALGLVGLGFVIGAWLESGLLGFIGADFVFLLAMAFYTSAQGGSSERRH